MSVLPVCMPVFHMCAVSWGPKEGTEFPMAVSYHMGAGK